MNDYPQRKLNRLKDYDYSLEGAYFVTICVKNMREVLGKIVNKQPVLSEYGLVIVREIEYISKIRKECVVEKYVVMPNHIHMIVHIVGDDGNRPVVLRWACPAQTDDCSGKLRTDCENKRADCHPPLRKSVSNMVQGFKGAVTRQIGYSIWQRSYYDHIIRNEDEYRKIWEYIDANPTNWGEDEYYAL